jgi:hypothetical protein
VLGAIQGIEVAAPNISTGEPPTLNDFHTSLYAPCFKFAHIPLKVPFAQLAHIPPYVHFCPLFLMLLFQNCYICQLSWLAYNLATIIGVTCAILVLLFAVQPFGTTKIATSFAPIVIIWLLFNLCSGIYNLVKFDHTVLKAFSPYFAGAYFMRNKEEGWRSLGGLLLAFTGVEALFADLGAFSKRAIQLSWLCLAYPCLLFAYIGQAAFISQDATGTAYTNPFFNTVP